MISVITLTYNQETTIEEHLKSLSFADEIIIIDNQSTDNTIAIAEKYNPIVLQREFENLSDQKNYAVARAKNDWICFLKLDEKITSALAEEISHLVKAESSIIAYRTNRDFYFMGKRIKYTGFQKDKVICLFHKTYFNQLEDKPDSAEIGRLTNKLQLHSYRDFDSFNQQLTKQGQLQAQELFNQNLRPNAYHFLIKPWSKFVQKYFWQLGFRDGKEGFILSYILAFAVFKRYLKLWMLYRKID